MKKHISSILLICLAVPLLYLAVFWSYFKAGFLNFDFLGRPISLGIDRTMVWLYTPCLYVEQAWKAKQERRKAEEEYYRYWTATDVSALILPDGNFTIRYYDQRLRGVGRFALDEDGRLHFTGDCDGQVGVDESFDAKNPQLLKWYEYERPLARRCTVWIRTYEGDDYTLQGAELGIHAADDPNLLLAIGVLSPGK